MRKSKDTQPEGDPLMEPTGNSGNFSRVSTVGGASDKATYDTLNARETKTEFKFLRQALESRASMLAEARTTIDEALPYLSNMQMLLSQRGAARRQVLKAARLPKWTEFISDYSTNLGYTSRQIRNLIRDFRGASTENKKQSHVNPKCRKMLSSLLALVERYGEHCPAPVTTQCRNIKQALAGEIDTKTWSTLDKDLQLAVERNLAPFSDPRMKEVPAHSTDCDGERTHLIRDAFAEPIGMVMVPVSPTSVLPVTQIA